jgi:peptide/nickel transport system substrate-binding protein
LEGASNNKGELLFTFRSPKSPVANLKVRQALVLGLNEKDLLDKILTSRGALRLTGPAPSSSYGSVDAGGFPARDVAGAKKLLAEAGLASGLKLTMIYSPGEFAKDLEVSEAIQGQLAEIGVDFKIVELEQGAYSTRRAGADWDVAPNGTGGWSGDAEFFIGNTKNNNGYESAAVNDLLTQGNNTMDPNKRLGLLQQALKLMWADIPWLWAFEVKWVHGVSKKLTGIELHPGGQLLLMKAQLAA